MLSDRDILEAYGKRLLDVKPFVASNLQPASLDVTLGNMLRVHRPSSMALDPMNPDSENVIDHFLDKDGPYLICPGEFVIGSTHESVKLSDEIVARLEGKSSLARLGLIPHVAAGFIDPGFEGEITLELKNMGARPIILRDGMFIGQLAFTRLENRCTFPYGSSALKSRYQGQAGPTLSKGISKS